MLFTMLGTSLLETSARSALQWAGDTQNLCERRGLPPILDEVATIVCIPESHQHRSMATHYVAVLTACSAVLDNVSILEALVDHEL